ncbi:5-oxoprolinase subunit PxpB [Pasteurellaceae bacterium LIM206]|nr:5-oxoprolinase subunit PxpB [Pasteurellaceae bacterium LIM206]
MKVMAISESALVCNLTPPANLTHQQKLWSLAEKLNTLDEISEVVLGMNNLTVFSREFADLSQLAEQIQLIWKEIGNQPYRGRYIEIPVSYGGRCGEDLFDVARFHKTSPEHIVEQHCAPVYTVYMLGFQPGFPYLGGLPESLHTPRHATPRTLVPAGSVGIGGAQTGIYPFGSPGGWRLIGHTETKLFDKSRFPPTLLKAGDQVKFVPIRIEL